MSRTIAQKLLKGRAMTIIINKNIRGVSKSGPKFYYYRYIQIPSREFKYWTIYYGLTVDKKPYTWNYLSVISESKN